MRRGLLLAVLVLTLAASADMISAAVSPPPIGANFTHYQNANCSLDYSGIVVRYSQPGVRRRVRAELAAMHAAGIQTLRLLLWHMSDSTGQHWGIVPSKGGYLEEPYRSNLIRYLIDVRNAGFEQLTLAFGPMWTNSPLGGRYDPTLFGENWDFIKDVRGLLKQYGPPSTHIDLMSEGAPPSWETPATLAIEEGYITQLWSNYVDAFGKDDASFSSVGADGPSDTVARMQNLIKALRASGRPLPGWFDIHPAYDHDGTLAVLQAVDAALTGDGLTQPLVIGEEAYNDAPVAAAIMQFISTSARPVLEVAEWPLTANHPCKDMNISPPYRADAYITTLTGACAPAPTPNPLPLPPIPTLDAAVGLRGAASLKTSTGDPVLALDSGPYRIVVKDRTSRAGFELRGPGIDRRTGVRFRGTVVWSVEIGEEAQYGSAYDYGSEHRSDAPLRGVFDVD